MFTSSSQGTVRDTSRLTGLYDDLLLRVVTNLPRRYDRVGLTACGTAVGSRWAGELLICGRAVNGWEKEPWFAQQAKKTVVRRDITARALTGWVADPCPMRWVTDLWHHQTEYNTARSAFWRVVRAVTTELRIASATEELWSSHLAWTNLYRVAPHQGGNPNGDLQSLQRDATTNLLRTELEQLQPRRLLFLTGASWATPILENLSAVNLTATGSDLVQMVGSIKESSEQRGKVVVAAHPQGKPEAQMVREILSAFAA